MARSRSKVVFVIGYAASGKTTFVQSKITPSDVRIETGDIVRDLTRTGKRVFDKNLDGVITEYIEHTIDTTRGRVFVSSPRSVDVVKPVIDYAGPENVKIYVLDVPYDKRRARYTMRGSGKDKGMTYDEVLGGDDTLGMGELMKWCADNKSKYDIEFVKW